MAWDIADRAGPFLDPDETLTRAVGGLKGPRVLMFFGLLGSLLGLRNYLVAVTNKHVYLFRAGTLARRSPKRVDEKIPLGEVEVRFSRSVPFNRLTVGKKGHAPEHTLWLGKLYSNDAEAVVSAANAPK